MIIDVGHQSPPAVIGVPSLSNFETGELGQWSLAYPTSYRKNGVNFHDASSGRNLILFDGRHRGVCSLSKSEES